MKNVSTKIIAGAAILGLAGVVYSFSSGDAPENPESKKYEVIRMVDGELTQFDTIVASTSDYTPDDYLNDLGFGADNNVNIIDMSSFDANCFIDGNVMGEECQGNGKPEGDCIFVYESEDENIEDGEHVIIKKCIKNGEEVDLEDGEHNIIIKKCIKDGEEVDLEEGDRNQEMRIEKRVFIDSDGEESDENVEMQIEIIMENLNMDSLIKVAMETEGMDAENVIMRKVMIVDEEFEGDGGTMEWHEMNTDGADYHKEIDGPNHHMEVAVWGEGEEDFTLLIVSDPNDSPSRAPSTNGQSSKTELKLFPNPASTSSQIQLNFEKKAPTAITITDIQGKVITKLELGKFKGQFNHDIDVEKWESGVYLVHVSHGSEKFIEKLIVE
jgi:Secretion system C-terminal sorting domain